MVKRRKRRRWSDDEKRMVCAQTRVPGVSVAQVARRYDVNANQIFNWLKDPRFCGLEATSPDEARFLPVEIVDAATAPDDTASVSIRGEIEVELANGHRLRFSGGQDPDAIARLVQALSP